MKILRTARLGSNFTEAYKNECITYVNVTEFTLAGPT